MKTKRKQYKKNVKFMDKSFICECDNNYFTFYPNKLSGSYYFRCIKCYNEYKVAQKNDKKALYVRRFDQAKQMYIKGWKEYIS